MVIIVKEVIGVDTISNGNNKPWDRILEYMESIESSEIIEFDFKGVEVYNPFGSDSFKKLLSKPNFGMTIHSNEKLVDSIKLMCVMNNQDDTRVKGVKPVVVHIETEEEKKIKKTAQDLQKYFVQDNDNHSTFNICDRYDQIGVPITVSYMYESIRIYSESTGIKDIKVYTKRMIIQPSVVDLVAKLIDDMQEFNIKLTIVSDDKDIQDKIGMYRGLVESGCTGGDDRYNVMKEKLVTNKVGIILKYKEGRAKDEFGRYGKGEVVSSRVAIFKEFIQKDGICAKMHVFSNNKFYTKMHWYLEHDSENLKSVEYEELIIPIEQLGVYNDFIGTKYHFSTAVQYQADDVIMYHIDSTGKVIGQPYTIPERIKAVLDDFNMDYDKESLEAYIQATNEILNR